MWRSILLFSTLIMALGPALAAPPQTAEAAEAAKTPEAEGVVDPLARPEPTFDEVKDKLAVTPDPIWQHVHELRALELEKNVQDKQQELATVGAGSGQ